MANERLRDALMKAGLTPASAAEKIGVDAKTIQRWANRDDRTPYPRHRNALSVLLGESESYLWPDVMSPDQQSKVSACEIVTTYPHRHSVPSELWGALLTQATETIEILVHAGLFLTERSDFIPGLAKKASSGVIVRINFGNPDSDAVELRSKEEELGPGVLGARIRYGLAAYRTLQGVDNIEFRFHEATLYNSLFRFDDQMIVNAHIFGVQAVHAPALHLQRLRHGDLFDRYTRSLNSVWETSTQAKW